MDEGVQVDAVPGIKPIGKAHQRVESKDVLGEDGIRRVSISPTYTEPEPDDMEPCAAPLPMEIDERPGVRGAYEVRFPAVTPVTPPAIGLSHAQWCDKVLNESLPGDGFGRGCFDTLPRFVVGDPFCTV